MDFNNNYDNLYDKPQQLDLNQAYKQIDFKQQNLQPYETQQNLQFQKQYNPSSNPMAGCELKCHSFMSTLKLEFTIVIFILSWINYGIFVKYKNKINAKASDKNAVANTGLGLGVCSSLLLIVGFISYFKDRIMMGTTDSLPYAVIGLIFGITVVVLSAINFALATKILPNSDKRNYNEDTIWNTSLGLLCCCGVIFLYSVYDFIQSYSHYKSTGMI